MVMRDRKVSYICDKSINHKAMVYLKVKENSAQAKAIINMLKTFDFVEFIEEPKPKTKMPNKTTQKALQELKNNKNLKRFKSVDSLMKDLNS